MATNSACVPPPSGPLVMPKISAIRRPGNAACRDRRKKSPDSASSTLDDWVDGLYLQCSSQWDGLRHFGGPDGWYGGWRGTPESDPEPLGIHHWAARGIIGRGVLTDLAAARAGTGYDPSTAVAFEPEELAAVLADAGAELRYGDILCVRTGWMSKYLALSATERGELAETLITALGMALGELFDFGPLAAACARAGRPEFLFVSVPLNLTGAVGSPANAVAVL